METESILKILEESIRKLDNGFEPIIVPCKGDPTEKQTDVSFIIMEHINGGQIPRFTVNVKDYLNIDGLSTEFGRVRNIKK